MACLFACGGPPVTRSPQHHVIYLDRQQHPQPIAVEGRLLQGLGWAFLLAVPLWAVLVGLALLVRGALGGV